MICRNGFDFQSCEYRLGVDGKIKCTYCDEDWNIAVALFVNNHLANALELGEAPAPESTYVAGVTIDMRSFGDLYTKCKCPKDWSLQEAKCKFAKKSEYTKYCTYNRTTIIDDWCDYK